jgi:hypothetical protein
MPAKREAAAAFDKDEPPPPDDETWSAAATSVGKHKRIKTSSFHEVHPRDEIFLQTVPRNGR